jgi:TIR domain-containing protein
MNNETCQRCGNAAYGSPLCDSCLDYVFTGKTTYKPEGAGYLTGLDLTALDLKQADLATVLRESPRQSDESDALRQHWVHVVDNYYNDTGTQPTRSVPSQGTSARKKPAVPAPLTMMPSSNELASVFISYGGPDELFAIALNEALITRGVQTFIFAKDARLGEKLHREMRTNINLHDRMILICSRTALGRHGVQNEIEEVLQREAREGGRTILLPITVDDYVFAEWTPERSDLALSVRDRVIGDFKDVKIGHPNFSGAVDRLVRSLRKQRPIAQAIDSTNHPSETPHVLQPDLRISFALRRGMSGWRDVSLDEIRVVLIVTNHANSSATAPHIRLQVPEPFSLGPIGIAARHSGAPLQFIPEAVRVSAGTFIAREAFVIHPMVPAEFAEVTMTVKGNMPVLPCEIRYQTAALNLNGGEGALHIEAAAIAQVLQRLVEPRER